MAMSRASRTDVAVEKGPDNHVDERVPETLFHRLSDHFQDCSFLVLLVGAVTIPGALRSPASAASPSITGVTATSLTDSATVTWTTDVPTDSQIEIGTTANYGAQPRRWTRTLATAHSQDLGGAANRTLCTTSASRVATARATWPRPPTMSSSRPWAIPPVGPLLDIGDTNVMNGNRFVSKAGGKVVSLSAHVGPVGSAPNNKFQMAIYRKSTAHRACCSP